MTRRWLLFIPLVIFAGLWFFLFHGLKEDPTKRDSALLTKPFPVFALSSLENPAQSVDESVLLGQVTLVNVWGSWCPACKKEMPQLLQLAEQGVKIVGVDYKDSRDGASKFLAQFGNPFSLSIFDPGGSLGFDLGVYGAPESFIVDAKGLIRYHHTGFISPEDVTQVILPQVQAWQ